MKKQKKTVTYYAVRETCPQPYYDVEINMDDINKKVIEYVKKHPEALNRVIVAIYSSADPCNMRLYDTEEEAHAAMEKANQSYSLGSVSYERVAQIKKKTLTTITEEIVVADNLIK